MPEQTLSTFTANLKSEALARLLDRIDEAIIKAMAESYDKEGHSLTGKLIKDISSEVTLDRGSIIVDYMAYKYGAYLNSGVKPGRIPFAPGSGAGKSLFISGLIKYVQQRMKIANLQEAKSIAFAIAHKQKKVGMPIRTNGQGTKWADNAADNVVPEINNIFADLSEEFIIDNLTDAFNGFNNK